jgi:hypothetical protein
MRTALVLVNSEKGQGFGIYEHGPDGLLSATASTTTSNHPVGAENPCRQAIFVDDAAHTVVAPDPERIQVSGPVRQ